MRIAVIQSFLPSRSQGGAGHHAHALSHEMARRGHSVTLFSQHPAPAGAAYRVHRVQPPLGGGRSLAARFSSLYLFPLALGRCDFAAYDVVHAHGDNQFLRLGGPPVVRTLHGAGLAEARNQPRWKHKALHLSLYAMELLGAARADVRVAISEHTRRYFPGVSAVVPGPIDLARFNPGETAKSAAPSILFVGHRLHDRKRGDLLLRVFAEEVLARVPDAELWMVSDDREAGRRVRWYANLPQDALIRLYQQAWLFCLPSRYEGFGMPYAEAMACGTPVIATPNAGAQEVLGGGAFGVLTEPEKLGTTLADLLLDPARRDDLRRRALSRAPAFSVQRAVDAYEALFERLLHRTTGAGAHQDLGRLT